MAKLIFALGVGIEPTRRGFGDLPDALSVPRKFARPSSGPTSDFVPRMLNLFLLR